MKKILPITLLLIVACAPQSKRSAHHSYEDYEMEEYTPKEGKEGFQLIELRFNDECPHEYINSNHGITHYPNCRFCFGDTILYD